MDENKEGDCENALHRKKHDGIMLNLDQKNLFADQTPTPTRLIKNCDELCLFEDLQNVNPFDETFRRAIDQKSTSSVATVTHADTNGEDSLHTPQVFPQLESSAEMLRKPLETPPISSGVSLDVPEVVQELLTETHDSSYKMPTTSRQNSGNATYFGFGKLQKYRSEKALTPTIGTENIANPAIRLGPLQQAAITTMQLYELNFPTETTTNPSDSLIADHDSHSNPNSFTPHSAAIPVQTVKPFILPKVSKSPNEPVTTSIAVITGKSSTAADTITLTTQAPMQPSHANQTPSSQLPIKERLKAILNFNSKTKDSLALQPKLLKQRSKRATLHCDRKSDDDCIERRRAASTRYRQKMRNEYKLLRQRNMELQAENEKLRQRVRQLEQQQQLNVLMPQQPRNDCNGNVVHQNVPVQLQIAPSTVHLVMNIPKLVVPADGRPLLLPAPITYNLAK